MSDLKEYIVRFYSGHNIHSSYTVKVDHVKHAVGTAIREADERVGDDVSRLTAAVTDALTGEGVAGIDNLSSKAQILAQIEKLTEQARALEPDDEQVAATVPNVNRNVTAPAVPQPSFSGPDPSASQVSAGTPVRHSADTVHNSPVSQADIDAALAAQQSREGE